MGRRAVTSHRPPRSTRLALAPCHVAVRVGSRRAPRQLLWWPKWGGIWYFDMPSPNTTVFSALWPTSTALDLWGSLVFPYTLAVR